MLPSLPSGVASTLGSPVQATRWVVPFPQPVDGVNAPARVAVVNPSSTAPVDVRVDVMEAAGPRSVGSAQVQPGRRFDVDIGPSTAALAVVEATGPVVTGELLALSAPDGLSAPPALAVGRHRPGRTALG